MEKTDTHPTGKRFQYQDLLDGLEVPCPPVDFRERETVAYRWVFGTMDDERNFLPQYVKKPNRFDSKEEAQKCLALGLSFFDKLDNAAQRFYKIRDRIPPEYWPSLESHIAVGTIGIDVGVQSEIGKGGHFTLFPYMEARLKERFSITAKL